MGLDDKIKAGWEIFYGSRTKVYDYNADGPGLHQVNYHIRLGIVDYLMLGLPRALELLTRWLENKSLALFLICGFITSIVVGIKAVLSAVLFVVPFFIIGIAHLISKGTAQNDVKATKSVGTNPYASGKLDPSVSKALDWRGASHLAMTDVFKTPPCTLTSPAPSAVPQPSHSVPEHS